MYTLDAENKELIPYLPYLLKDLWELGSIHAYKYELLNKNMLTRDKPAIIDLGCGKGAELVQLSQKFDFEGTGVDIIPEFIDDANFRKRLNNCEHLTFILDDYKENLSKYSNYDVLFFVYDEVVFGSISDTLKTLKNVIRKDSGYILFDNAFLKDKSKADIMKGYDTYSSIKTQITSSGYDILAYIFWDNKYVSRMNEFNNICIAKRAEELSEKYPDKKELFNSYTKKQIEVSKLLENDLTCITWLLRSN